MDLEEFLRRQGEKLLRAGRESRLARVRHITVRGSEWYDHAARQGGHAVSFVQHFYGTSYQEAMELLLGNELGKAYPAAQPKREESARPFALPPPHTDMRRVYAYLMKQRHISREVVTHFARAGLLYEDAQYHNCVFVGTDEQGVPRHAHKRSTNSQGKSFKVNVEGSRPQYSFHHAGRDSIFYVFEAPVDMLSFLTLYPDRWQPTLAWPCAAPAARPCIGFWSKPPASGMWCSAWITMSRDRPPPGASRKNCREQDTTAVSCSLCIRTGTTTWCRGRPWPALPWPWDRACSHIPVPEPHPARQGGGTPCRWTGPRFILDHQEGHIGRRSKYRGQTTGGR